MTPRPLPDPVRALCAAVGAPPRLVAHLTLVHDVACELTDHLAYRFPTLQLDREVVLFGAAIHDIGKARHLEEITSSDKSHEKAGEALLNEYGIPPQRSRFARTHGAWNDKDVMLEDLLVALADSIWKGRRADELESLVAKHIAKTTSRAEWAVWASLDDVLSGVAADADRRLEWQRQHTI